MMQDTDGQLKWIIQNLIIYYQVFNRYTTLGVSRWLKNQAGYTYEWVETDNGWKNGLISKYEKG